MEFTPAVIWPSLGERGLGYWEYLGKGAVLDA